MTAIGWLQAVVFFLIVLALTKPIGLYMARVFEGSARGFRPCCGRSRRSIYRLGGVREDEEMTWYAYALSMLAFSVIGLVYLYVLLRTQKWLPFNPQHFDNMAPDLAWNTAVSFLTNTNWQFYSGESTMSYLSQMAGLAWHNFVSAAAGIAIAVAVVRGLVRTNVKDAGQLLGRPDALLALHPVCRSRSSSGSFFVSQGVPQNFHAYQDVKSHRRVRAVDHRRPDGLARSHQGARHQRRRLRQRELRVAERESESADQSLRDGADLLPRCRPDVHVRQDGQRHAARLGDLRRDGDHLFRRIYDRVLGRSGRKSDRAPARRQPAAIWKAKSAASALAASALFATVTTDTSCGAVNSMHDSFMPLGGLVPLVNMQLGEIIFGGVGSGLYGMIIFVVLTVFIAGLMVGRTPGVSREEDRAARGAVRDPRGVGDAGAVLGADGDRRDHPRRTRDAEQRGSARLLGDSLRVHLDQREQRVGLRAA